MKDDVFVVLAKGAGFEYHKDDENFYVGGIACTTTLKRFTKIVEQATLESVAKHFEGRDVYELFNCNRVAREIRLLKDSHE